MPFLILRFNFSFDIIRPKSKNYIVLSNHNLNWDPLLLAMSFPKQMYYVASEHIFRKGLLSKLLVYFLAPISRIKGTSEIMTVKRMTKILRSGANVCIFPEGICTHYGVTQPITEAIGKLVKMSGAGMVTYNLIGAFIARPRWADSFRKTKIQGRFVREYTSEELGNMSFEEINKAIHRDLYVNAYDEYAKNPVKIKVKNAAQKIEYALYACPECGALASLKSEGDSFRCACCHAAYKCTPDCRITREDGTPYRYERIYEWDAWQKNHLQAVADKAVAENDGRPLLEDDGQLLYEYRREKKSKLISEATMRMYTDRLTFETTGGDTHVFLFKDMSGLDLHSTDSLVFSTADNNYEVKTLKVRSPLLYEDMFIALKNS
jgi:1-acyl-sn-glycerol-3-phosphate acyltransferase